jgi:hypothetical protein
MKLKSDLQQTNATATEALPLEPTTQQAGNELTLLDDLFCIIAAGQAEIDEHKQAVEINQSEVAKQVGAIDELIKKLREDFRAHEEGQILVKLTTLELVKEPAVKILHELLPAPTLDIAALEDRLGKAFFEFRAHYLDLLRRAHRAQVQQALKRLEQTLGNDPSHDAEGIDREAIAGSSPACRRIEAMIEAREGFSRLSFRLDSETDYRALYQSLLDEVRRELELVEGELPPSVPEPDRKIKVVIADRGEWPEELPPNGWTVRREVAS